MAIQTAHEQLALELINRARLDPAAEAARYGIALNEGMAAGTIAATAKEPLAMNDKLITAARAHSKAMIDHDFSGHDNPVTGSTPVSRANAAGYSSDFVGENIGRSGDVVPYTPAMVTQAVFDQHEFLFVDPTIPGRGHRINILFEDYKELGVGGKTGLQNLPGGSPDDRPVAYQTFDFGLDDDVRFLTGVAFNDTAVNDDFYTIGEARAGVKVTAGVTTTGGVAGGYSLKIGDDAVDVTFSGGGLAKAMKVALGAGTENVKIDIVDGNTIFSSADLTLVTGVTRATLLGVANRSLTGSALADTLTGNKGNNKLDGGAGADTLRGLLGHDSYVVDRATDRIIELAGQGTDSVSASVNYVLAATAAVESMKTTVASATTAIKLTGNDSANKITGNAGNNTLNGRGGSDTLVGAAGNDSLNGGLGKDTINGGVGADTIVFNSALGPTNIDTVVFSVVHDIIKLENLIFTKIGQASGTLAPGRYHEGSAAHDATDRIVYNNANGALLYDSDGTGAAAAIQFAKLGAGLAASLSNVDFAVI